MRLWHVADKGEPDFDTEVEQSGGYVVLAETADAAVALVEQRELQEFREQYPDGDEAKRRWYHVGVSDRPWPPEWVARPLDATYRIPFLGYSW